MQSVRVLLVAVCAAFLVGCVTADPHKPSAVDVRQISIVDFQVNIAPTARLSWPEEEDAAMREKYGPSATRSPAPEDQALVRARTVRTLSERLRSTLMTEVGPDLKGPRKARAIVTVKYFSIPTLGERILVDNDARFDAEIVLVDARSNDQIFKYSGGMVTARMTGGLLAPVVDAAGVGGSDRSRQLVFEYTDKFKKWLLNA